MVKLLNLTTADGTVNVLLDELVLIKNDLTVRTAVHETTFVTTDSLASIAAQYPETLKLVTPVDGSGIILVNNEKLSRIATVEGGYKLNFNIPQEPIVVEETPALIAGATAVKKTAILLLDMAVVANRAIGSHALTNLDGSPFLLPNKSFVTRADYEVLTTFTSATDAATIALGVATDAAAGIKAAVAISDAANPYDAAVPKVTLATGATAAFLTKTTGARAVQATVAVEALTAGKLVVMLDYTTTL